MLINFNAPSASGSKRGSFYKANKPQKRMNHAKRATKHKDISNSRKKADKKAIPVTEQSGVKINGRSQSHYVFIGNINPSTSNGHLEKFVKYWCGDSVIRITRRCSRGEGVSVGAELPLSMRAPRDRQYATVEFTCPSAVKRAFKMNNRVLSGCELVVCLSPAGLPEAVECIEEYREKLEAKKREKMGKKPLISPNKRNIYQHPTESFIDPNAPVSDRHRIFNYSFGKSVL